jgi:tRNA pseudouridine38-40 synthase
MTDSPDPTQDEREARRAPFRGCAPDHWRVKLLISYDGTDYCGWQRQTSQVTVQGTLEAALSKIYCRPIVVLGASRTDAGVHALGQVAHFDAPKDPSSFDLRYSLQRLTPPTLVIREAWESPRDFHAIASSVKKTYKYLVLNRQTPSALRHKYTHWIRYPLDIDYLNEASQFLLGEHDFRSFQVTGSDVKTTVRQIHEAKWRRLDEDTLEFEITGNGFLKQMVRGIVGSLIGLNQDQKPAMALKTMIDAQDRRQAGVTAPPQGLYLKQVYYPEELDIKCRKL